MRCLLLLLLAPPLLHAADWPQFLGPARDGHAASAEPALPKTLAVAEPEILWKKSAGSGFAGPVVSEGKVILFHREGGEMTTEALDARTGTQLWRHSYITDYVDSFGFDNGPRAVPAVAEGRVFTHGPEGRVTALALDTGRELWAYDTAAHASSPQGFFGRAPSPLVIGRSVIIAAGGQLQGQGAGIIALDAEKGTLLWHSVDDEAAYASPIHQGDHLLCWMRNRLWLLDAATGRVLHSLPLRSRMDASVNAATPLHCGPHTWFVSAGYGVGANLFEVSPSSAQLNQVWSHQDVLDCHYATPIHHAGHLYGFHGRQETGMRLRCIRLSDASTLWEAPEKIPGGTLLLVQDQLLILTEQGELWVVPATPERFEKSSAQQILRAGHRSHAAYADGIFYARDSEHLIALPLR